MFYIRYDQFYERLLELRMIRFVFNCVLKILWRKKVSESFIQNNSLFVERNWKSLFNL